MSAKRGCGSWLFGKDFCACEAVRARAPAFPVIRSDYRNCSTQCVTGQRDVARFSLHYIRTYFCPGLVKRRKVANAGRSLVSVIGSFHAHSPKAAIATFVQGRVIDCILPAQFVGHFSIRIAERSEAPRFVKSASSRRCKLRQPLFTLIQHAQTFAKIIDAKLIESHG